MLPKIKQEVTDIGELIEQQEFKKGNYRLHAVPINNTLYLAADAKSMNKHDNQSGRGCWRYIFNKENQQYVGIAKEQDSGSYRWM
ncbi:hypothetical protein K9M74_02060 [Candidatus Woesearchaeota archaeon]|nr:hypothetical protein [Candidatus Woesearchaeota archaeon]